MKTQIPEAEALGPLVLASGYRFIRQGADTWSDHWGLIFSSGPKQWVKVGTLALLSLERCRELNLLTPNTADLWIRRPSWMIHQGIHDSDPPQLIGEGQMSDWSL